MYFVLQPCTLFEFRILVWALYWDKRARGKYRVKQSKQWQQHYCSDRERYTLEDFEVKYFLIWYGNKCCTAATTTAHRWEKCWFIITQEASAARRHILQHRVQESCRYMYWILHFTCVRCILCWKISETIKTPIQELNMYIWYVKIWKWSKFYEFLDEKL